MRLLLLLRLTLLLLHSGGEQCLRLLLNHLVLQQSHTGIAPWCTRSNRTIGCYTKLHKLLLLHLLIEDRRRSRTDRTV
uniref:Putative secreted protein n=1 Tax=Anopheles triannulatus TaxID=58253 RepID=A0A2M4B588_9DIPT